MTAPVPKRVAELTGQVGAGFHPGLYLDKLLDPPADAKEQKPILENVCAARPNGELLSSLSDRRRRALPAAVAWTGKTQGL